VFRAKKKGGGGGVTKARDAAGCLRWRTQGGEGRWVEGHGRSVDKHASVLSLQRPSRLLTYQPLVETTCGVARGREKREQPRASLFSYFGWTNHSGGPRFPPLTHARLLAGDVVCRVRLQRHTQPPPHMPARSDGRARCGTAAGANAPAPAPAPAPAENAALTAAHTPTATPADPPPTKRPRLGGGVGAAAVPKSTVRVGEEDKHRGARPRRARCRISPP